MYLMALGTMLGIRNGLTVPLPSRVRSHALSLVEDLDRSGCRADFDQLLHQGVGNAVEVLVEYAMVVDVNPRLTPLAQVIGRRRQRLQSRLVYLLEQASPAAASFLEWSVIEDRQQFPDRCIGFTQAKELAMAQGRQDPTLHHLDVGLYGGFIASFVGTSRENSDAIMNGECLIGRI